MMSVSISIANEPGSGNSVAVSSASTTNGGAGKSANVDSKAARMDSAGFAFPWGSASVAGPDRLTGTVRMSVSGMVGPDGVSWASGAVTSTANTSLLIASAEAGNWHKSVDFLHLQNFYA